MKRVLFLLATTASLAIPSIAFAGEPVTGGITKEGDGEVGTKYFVFVSSAVTQLVAVNLCDVDPSANPAAAPITVKTQSADEQGTDPAVFTPKAGSYWVTVVDAQSYTWFSGTFTVKPKNKVPVLALKKAKVVTKAMGDKQYVYQIDMKVCGPAGSMKANIYGEVGDISRQWNIYRKHLGGCKSYVANFPRRGLVGRGTTRFTTTLIDRFNRISNSVTSSEFVS